MLFSFSPKLQWWHNDAGWHELMVCFFKPLITFLLTKYPVIVFLASYHNLPQLHWQRRMTTMTGNLQYIFFMLLITFLLSKCSVIFYIAYDNYLQQQWTTRTMNGHKCQYRACHYHGHDHHHHPQPIHPNFYQHHIDTDNTTATTRTWLASFPISPPGKFFILFIYFY